MAKHSEKEKIFKKDWLAVARVEEIENAGDYMTFDIVGEPIIVARNTQSELNAFYNVCVHRGTEVAAGAGNVAHFKCPYHAWTYDLSGQLVGAAYMDDIKDFELDACRLRAVRLEVWEGWVFINFDELAEPLAAFVAEFAEEFGVFQQSKMRLNRRLETTLNCNWKLVNEKFCRHLPFPHPACGYAGQLAGSRGLPIPAAQARRLCHVL